MTINLEHIILICRLSRIAGHPNRGLHVYRDEREPPVDVPNGFVLRGSHRARDAVWRVHAGVEEVWRVGDQTEAAQVCPPQLQ